MKAVAILLAMTLALCTAQELCGVTHNAKILPVDSLGHKLVFETETPVQKVIAHIKPAGETAWENLDMLKVDEKTWETRGPAGVVKQTAGIFLLPGQTLTYFFTYETNGKMCDSPQMESTPSGIHNEFRLPTSAGALVTTETTAINLAQLPSGVALYTVGAITAEQAKAMGEQAALGVQTPLTTLITLHPRELPIQQKQPLTAKQETAQAITNKPIHQTYQQQVKQPMTQILRQPIIQPVLQPIVQPVIQQAQPVVQPEVTRRVEAYVVRQVSPQLSTKVHQGPALQPHVLQPVVSGQKAHSASEALQMHQTQATQFAQQPQAITQAPSAVNVNQEQLMQQVQTNLQQGTGSLEFKPLEQH